MKKAMFIISMTVFMLLSFSFVAMAGGSSVTSAENVTSLPYSQTVTLDSTYQYWKVTPEVTGDYTFTVTSDINTNSCLLSPMGRPIAYPTSNGGLNLNASWTLTAGSDYYFVACAYQRGMSGTAVITISTSSWTVEDGVLTISGSIPAVSTNSTAPWSSLSSSITSCVITGCPAIGDSAFYGMTGLRNVTIGEGTVSIGSKAFMNCSSLESVSIPSTVKSIGAGAFRQSGITEISIPSGVTAIESMTFYQCSALKSISIPGGIKLISAMSFRDCTSLSTVYYSGTEETRSSIKASNYSYGTTTLDSELTNAEWIYTGSTASEPETPANSCGDDAAWALENGTLTVSGKGSVTSAPWDKASVTRVVIEDGITIICADAFNGCANLTTVELAGSVVSIGRNAFAGCSITAIYADSINQWLCYDHFSCGLYMEKGGKLYIDGEELTDVVANASIPAYAFCNLGITSATITSGAGRIGEKAFYGCEQLTSVSIASSVEYIGTDAFSACRNLTEIRFDTLSQWLGYDAENSKLYLHKSGSLYMNGAKITSLTVPSSVEEIGNSAFRNCADLTTVSFGENLTWVSSSAFTGCANLKEIHADSVQHWLELEHADSGLYLHTAGSIFAAGEELTDLIIPEGTTEIGMFSFMNCTGISSVTFPASLTSIEYGAFDECNAISTVYCENSIDSIEIANYNVILYRAAWKAPVHGSINGISWNISDNGILTLSGNGAVEFESAPWDETTVNGIHMENGITSVCDNAFGGCANATVVYIPESLTSIGTGAFTGCGISEIHFSTISQWLGFDHAQTGLRLSASGKLYVSGEQLTSLEIPEGTTSVGSYAFTNCKDLDSVSIPASLTSIGASAFTGCTALEEISFESLEQWLSLNHIESGLYLHTSGTLYVAEEPIVSLIIPEGTEVISARAFANCADLTSVSIPAGVTAAGREAFTNCTAINEINVASVSQWLSLDHENSGLYLHRKGHLNVNGSCVKEISITEGTTAIAAYTFRNCTDLSAVSIPASVSSIGNSAFAGCGSLTAVYSENAMDSMTIGENNSDLVNADWFDPTPDLESLNTMTLPKYMKQLGSCAFSGIAAEVIVIPATCTYVAPDAFDGCDNLRYIINNSEATVSPIDGVYIINA